MRSYRNSIEQPQLLVELSSDQFSSNQCSENKVKAMVLMSVYFKLKRSIPGIWLFHELHQDVDFDHIENSDENSTVMLPFNVKCVFLKDNEMEVTRLW